MSTLAIWLISAAAVFITAKIVKGFEIDGILSALLAAVGIGLCNLLIRPILLFLTLPINILTLGLFTFVVNAIVLRIAAALIPGFRILSWMAAFFGAIILMFVQILLQYLIYGRETIAVALLN